MEYKIDYESVLRICLFRAGIFSSISLLLVSCGACTTPSLRLDLEKTISSHYTNITVQFVS